MANVVFQDCPCGLGSAECFKACDPWPARGILVQGQKTESFLQAEHVLSGGGQLCVGVSSCAVGSVSTATGSALSAFSGNIGSDL
jgi:hypothetical protein